MSKVLVIGIDALDSLTLSKYYPSLQNFRTLKEANPSINFDGVIPPDSPTSWASIYTGLNPAKHGIVLFVDPLKKVSKMITNDVDDRSIRGRTFWDFTSKAGKKVFIAPHLLGFPVWPVNGIMVGRSGITKEVQAYPEEIARKCDLSQFRWDLDLFPGRNKEKYIEATKNQIKRETTFALDGLKKYEWDLFFVSFGELDPIQYSFWNYYDEEDPGFPGETKYKDVIPEFYKLFDQVIGDFWKCVGSDVNMVVVSDHGIGSRPVELININELLRRKSLLMLNGAKTNNDRTSSGIMLVKRSILEIIDKYDLGNVAAIALRIFPRGKDIFISSQHINWENSIAYLTDQSGIKNYPYGGITIKKENIIISNYDEIKSLIINELLQLRDPRTNKKIIENICEREDIYDGEHIQIYPDILFELKDDFGAGTSTPSDLFGKSLTHNLAPGCHKQHHATFLISDINLKEEQINMTLMDVAPTILDLLGIEWKVYPFDGHSIIRG